MTEAFTIRSTDALALEAELDAPADPVAGVVLCHPHPQMGGTMNAPLLTNLVAHLIRRNWAVLRFNFRGIGASEGDTGIGLEEVADAAGAIAEMRARYELPIAVAGWSFGGAVAIRVALRESDLAGTACIAPAIKAKPDVTAGLPPPQDVALTAPLLVVCGANDDLVDPRDAEAWTTSVGGRFVEMPGANHFFWAKYDALADLVCDFLDETL